MYCKKVCISTSTVLPAAYMIAVSMVALIVSFMAASYLYARSTIIPYGVLLAVSFTLLELLVGVYFFVLSEFSSSLFGKKEDAPNLEPDIVQTAPAQPEEVQADPVPPVSDNISPTQPVREGQMEKLLVPDPTNEIPAISTSKEPASSDAPVPNPAQSQETTKKIVELMSLSAEEQQKRREKFAQDRKEIM